MSNDNSTDTKRNPFRGPFGIIGQIVFPIIAIWFGVKAILEQKARIRMKGSNTQGQEVWMLGQDAVEFGIGLLLFAVATHVLLYKKFLPTQYHTCITWIFRITACGGIVCWGLSSL